VEKEAKATRSGNARIHGMTRVTTSSIAYIATQVCLGEALVDPITDICFSVQVRFALSSSSVFCRTDTSTDSGRFYESVLAFLDEPEEKHEVEDLLNWWNW
jgi:hypothetical protein